MTTVGDVMSRNLLTVEPATELRQAAERMSERGGHVDERIEAVVRPTGFEHEHGRGRVDAQAVGERAAGRAAADDHEIGSPAARA